jgi:hypothetical protein
MRRSRNRPGRRQVCLFLLAQRSRRHGRDPGRPKRSHLRRKHGQRNGESAPPQDPTLCNTVTLGSADASWGVPYWFREADVQPNGHYFDSPNNTVPTQGRAISTNARTNLDTADVTTTQSSDGCLVAAEAVNYGGGQDLGNWGAGQLDTSHRRIPHTSLT